MNRVKCFPRIKSKSLYRIKYARNSRGFIKDREKAHGRKLINYFNYIILYCRKRDREIISMKANQT